MHARRLLIVLALWLALPASAQAAAGWAPTGSMRVGRTYFGAALLNDGRVLVAGGYASPLVTNTAELYDPASGIWSPAGSMTAPRARHSMITLTDGKVLAVGGTNNSFTELDSAEVYNPATNTWTAVSNFGESRYDATLTMLPDGHPLLAAGNSYAQNRLSTWRYEPDGTWTAAGPLSEERTNAAAAALPDGRVVLAGGRRFNTYLATTQIYDGAWRTTTANMKLGRTYFGLTPISGGRLLATGGSADGGVTASAEIFSGTWGDAPSLATARWAHTQTALANGKVLVTGGMNAANAGLASTELYDPVANTWTSAGSLSEPRWFHSAVRLADGRVLVIGGGDAGGAPASSTELFTPATNLSTVGSLGYDPAGLGRRVVAPLQVTNTGDAPLFVGGFALSGAHPGDFAVNGDRCRGAVAPGVTCIVDVSFVPTADGPRTAVLTFGANTGAATYAVALSGRGVADADGDGVTDTNDRCRTLKGSAARQGCPKGLVADPSIRYKPSGKGIRVVAYYVKATSGARVTVKCSKGCKRTITKGKGAKRVRITRLNNHRLANGTKITITVAKTGRLTTTVTDRVSRGRRIEGRPRCTPVGC